MSEYTAFAFERLTVSSGTGAVGFTPGKYNPGGHHLPTRKVIFTVEPGAPIAFTLDGTTVTSGTDGVGHKMTPFQSYTIEGFENIKNFQSLSITSGTAGAISVTYYR